MSRLRWLTSGESHGKELVAIVEGVPAGLGLRAEDIDADLARRQQGYGRGPRMKIEHDHVVFLSGVRGGETIGSPLGLEIKNRDFESWQDKMSPLPFEFPVEALTRPRPGHADLAGGLKYDRHDLRDVLERASARETAARTAVGGVAKKLLSALGVDVFAHVLSIGDVSAPEVSGPWSEVRKRARSSDLNCPSAEAEARMKQAIQKAAHQGDTLGGGFEVVATGVVAGLGSHVQWDRKLDGRLAQALMCIQAIKAVEIGEGYEGAHLPGSRVHDPIGYDGTRRAFVRSTNHAGGLEGGMTNGEPVVCRAWMKPIATLRQRLPSVDIVTKEPNDAAFERSDVCAVAAASVVGEAMVAITLADAVLEKFGGDSVRELTRTVEAYRDQIREF
jgi:chorismate synthase